MSLTTDRKTTVRQRLAPSILPYHRISDDTMKAFNISLFRRDEDTILWIIPIHNERGENVGLIKRDTNTFRDNYEGSINRHKVVFNLNRVLSDVNNTREITITEDLYDCIGLWQAGEHHIVSLLGSKLSNSQFHLIFKFLSPSRIRFILSPNCFDLESRLETISKFASKAYIRIVTSFRRNNTRLLRG
jgi:hypothetical protein